MTTPVLATKLFVPAARRGAVARPQLLERLDAALEAGRRLTVVTAPAGFGKTTMLSDWVAKLPRQHPDTRAAWLSLDVDDDDPARFLIHLVAALEGAELPLGGVVDRARDDLTAVMIAVINSAVQAAQSSPKRRWVFVLDDYHVLTATSVHQAMAFLVEHLPDQLHLVLATRSDPPLPMARLRAGGQLNEARAVDLRFTADQAEQFLNQSMGLRLDAEQVRALTDRTEGWIAGLQLAAVSLRGVDNPTDVAAFVDAFTGSNRFVIDYLADEVLARQSPQTQQFLLRAAVLDRLTGPLCDAVTDTTGGARTLEQLERADLFLIPLDDRRGWYRFHHLFADVLRARLQADHPDEISELHRRASAWYADAELVPEAVRHALHADDYDRAGTLMEQALPQVRRARQDALLQEWVHALPEEVLRRSPVLTTVSAWAQLMAGDLDAAESRLDIAEAVLAAGATDAALRDSWPGTEDLRTAPATIEVYRASLAQARGDVPGTVRHARRALELAAPNDHFVHGAGQGFLGLAAWAAGDVGEALRTFAEAVRSLQAAGNHTDALDATIPLADMWLAAGRPTRARRLYEEALRTATSAGEPFPRATADLHVGLAELDLADNDPTGAETHLEAARQLAERGSITENRHRWFLVKALHCSALGDHVHAQQLLDEAQAIYRHGFYPDVRPIAAVKARIQIAAGDVDGAAGWADGRMLSLEDDPEYLREYDHLTLVRLLLARKDEDPNWPATYERVLALLRRLENAAAAGGRERSVREVRVLRALTLHAGGDLQSALDALEESFDTPEPDSAVRLYTDQGAAMEELSQHTALNGRTPGLAPRPGRDTGSVSVPATVPASLPDPLSGRELQVLRLLESDLTGPQIAAELYVSVNTLRTHTKRIFTKLDVSTRAAAVRRARELGLLGAQQPSNHR